MHHRLSVALILGASACGLFGSGPNVSSPAHHSEAGVAFDYPSNWKVSSEVDDELGVKTHSITIDGNRASTLLITITQPPEDLTSSEASLAFNNALVADFKTMGSARMGASKPVKRTMLGSPLDGTQQHVQLSLMGEKLTSITRVWTHRDDAHSYMIITSADNEDRPTEQPGFDLVLDSLKAQ